MSRLDHGLGPAVEHRTVGDLVARLGSEGRARLSGLHGSARALIAVAIARELQRPLLYVTRRSRELDAAEAALAYFAEALGGVADVHALPGYEVDPLQGVSPHPDVLARRMRALGGVGRASGSDLIVATSPLGLAGALPTLEELRRGVLPVADGDELAREDLLMRLAELGYRKEWRVETPGEFALRGGIVDIFPAGAADPIRVELDGRYVDSLRTFSPATQRSLETLSEIELTAVRETRLEPDARERVMDALAGWGERRGKEEAAERMMALLEAKGSFPGIEHWSETIHGVRRSVGELMEEATGSPPLVVFDEWPAAAEAYEELRERVASDLDDPDTALLPDLPTVLPEAATLREGPSGPVLELAELGRMDGEPHLGTRQAPAFAAKLGELCRLLIDRRQKGEHTLLLLSSEGARDRVAEILEEYEVTQVAGDGGVDLGLGSLSGGFEMPDARFLVLTEEEIFGTVLVKGRRTRKGEKGPAPRRRAGFQGISDFHDLKIGDYVVHVDNGVGRFQGLSVLGEGAEARELMLLQYQGGDKLYVPIDRLDLVQKYQGPEGVAPKVDRLGGTSWERTRQRVKKAVREIGDELLKLYAARATARGFGFSADTPWQREFEDTFPYDETPDQQIAIADVKADMEQAKPMDRLLCGDVGYGKTEVAMRAAFKAVSDGKQVAVLAPTTVLAFQHYRTFQQRMLPFPVRVAMLSRFVPPKEQKVTVAEAREGRVDILIGTHRILSKDVGFADLGLVIVDEEQRFGVAQKEKLKALRTRVDILTMTATPIPRTMQMALAGIRDLSVIETPPKNRLSIQTSVQVFRDDVVQFAIRRELSRSGQVFFVHHRVDSIYAMASKVSELVPEARVVVGHGQMSEREMEQVMLRFVEGRADVLVATTIIENGLDIPLANTMVVNRADRFGLSQLYQLRGRVGRADRRAYALLLVPSLQGLSDVARKRLAAIEEFSELGAGFKVAALDLQIRGGGNLLGAQQHGHIEAVGFDLYLQLLDEAIRELRGEEVAPEIRVNLNLKVDVRIPSDFLPDTAERMVLYKRISQAADDAEVDRIEGEVRDLYGRPPLPVLRLLELTRVRNLAMQLRIENIERNREGVSIRFHASTPLSPDQLMEFLAGRPGAQVRDGGTIRVPFAQSERDRPVSTTRALLADLSGSDPVRESPDPAGGGS